MTYAVLRRSARLQAKCKPQVKSTGKHVKLQLHPKPSKSINVGDGNKTVSIIPENAAIEGTDANNGDPNPISTMHGYTNQPTLVCKKDPSCNGVDVGFPVGVGRVRADTNQPTSTRKKVISKTNGCIHAPSIDRIRVSYETSPSSDCIAISIHFDTKTLMFMDPRRHAEKVASLAGFYDQKDYQVHQALLNLKAGRVAKLPTLCSSRDEFNSRRYRMFTFIPMPSKSAGAWSCLVVSVHDVIKKVLRAFVFLTQLTCFRDGPNGQLNSGSCLGCFRRAFLAFIQRADVDINETHSLADDFRAGEGAIIAARLEYYAARTPRQYCR